MKLAVAKPAVLLVVICSQLAFAQTFSCPTGYADVMKYFAMSSSRRATSFMDKGATNGLNPIYTEVFPNQDFATSGYWFWLKDASAGAGFDVKAFDQNYVYARSTEWNWVPKQFKRFAQDMPLATRCVASGSPGPEVKVQNTTFKYYANCAWNGTSSTVGTAVNDLDKPLQMDVGGNVGVQWVRVLHYHYNCDTSYANCHDEEKFYLANGYGLWQWEHYHNGTLVQTALMDELTPGSSTASLCTSSYQ